MFTVASHLNERVPLTERQQIEYLLNATARENQNKGIMKAEMCFSNKVIKYHNELEKWKLKPLFDISSIRKSDVSSSVTTARLIKKKRLAATYKLRKRVSKKNKPLKSRPHDQDRVKATKRTVKNLIPKKGMSRGRCTKDIVHAKRQKFLKVRKRVFKEHPKLKRLNKEESKMEKTGKQNTPKHMNNTKGAPCKRMLGVKIKKNKLKKLSKGECKMKKTDNKNTKKHTNNTKVTPCKSMLSVKVKKNKSRGSIVSKTNSLLSSITQSSSTKIKNKLGRSLKVVKCRSLKMVCKNTKIKKKPAISISIQNARNHSLNEVETARKNLELRNKATFASFSQNYTKAVSCTNNNEIVREVPVSTYLFPQNVDINTIDKEKLNTSIASVEKKCPPKMVSNGKTVVKELKELKVARFTPLKRKVKLHSKELKKRKIKDAVLSSTNKVLRHRSLPESTQMSKRGTSVSNLCHTLDLGKGIPISTKYDFSIVIEPCDNELLQRASIPIVNEDLTDVNMELGSEIKTGGNHQFQYNLFSQNVSCRHQEENSKSCKTINFEEIINDFDNDDHYLFTSDILPIDWLIPIVMSENNGLLHNVSDNCDTASSNERFIKYKGAIDAAIGDVVEKDICEEAISMLDTDTDISEKENLMPDEFGENVIDFQCSLVEKPQRENCIKDMNSDESSKEDKESTREDTESPFKVSQDVKDDQIRSFNINHTDKKSLQNHIDVSNETKHITCGAELINIASQDAKDKENGYTNAISSDTTISQATWKDANNEENRNIVVDNSHTDVSQTNESGKEHAIAEIHNKKDGFQQINKQKSEIAEGQGGKREEIQSSNSGARITLPLENKEQAHHLIQNNDKAAHNAKNFVDQILPKLRSKDLSNITQSKKPKDNVCYHNADLGGQNLPIFPSIMTQKQDQNTQYDKDMFNDHDAQKHPNQTHKQDRQVISKEQESKQSKEPWKPQNWSKFDNFKIPKRVSRKNAPKTLSLNGNLISNAEKSSIEVSAAESLLLLKDNSMQIVSSKYISIQLIK